MPIPERDQNPYTPFTRLMQEKATKLKESGERHGVSFEGVKKRLKDYRKKVRHINEGGD